MEHLLERELQPRVWLLMSRNANGMLENLKATACNVGCTVQDVPVWLDDGAECLVSSAKP